jgi:YidC/Oxa1 family membrane protein insertase
MNKKDLPIIVVLFIMLFGWQFIYTKYFAPPPAAPVPQTAEAGTGTNAVSTVAGSTNTVKQAAAISNPTSAVVGAEVAPVVVDDGAPEVLTLLTNDLVSITFSSKGASVVKGVFHDYHYTAKGATNVFFNFADKPSLVYEGIDGLGDGASYQGVVDKANNAISYTRAAANGLQLKRTYTLQPDNYVVLIKDEFFNTGAATVGLPPHKIRLGHILKLPETSAMMPPSGLDAFNQNEVTHYSFKLSKWVRKSDNKKYTNTIDQPVEWVAAKNKYFGHLICALEGNMGTPTGFDMYASQSGESKYPDNVAAALKLPVASFEPGQTFAREYTYYIGPKKVSMLKKLSNGEENIMEYGRTKIFVPICNGLLKMLNFIQPLVNNFGVAIILLTVFVKLIFWPLTHKGNESMKRMQALAPELKKIKEKHKDPQKQQQATMALYKENKVNPVSGCLPMLIQIPVFLGLFGVLRSAVELWNADFLWITDLSEPENMLAAYMPAMLGGLNVLPLAMAGTMFFQTRMTPTASTDPAQQMVMKMMPIFLLFVCYKMAAGLLLYWTTSNILAIAQMKWNQRQTSKEAEAGPVLEVVEKDEKPKDTKQANTAKRKRKKNK